MQLKAFVQQIIPPLYVWLLCLVLPLLLGGYFFISGYQEKFINNGEIDYYSLHQDAIGGPLITLSYGASQFANRAIDFVFWGVLISVVFAVAWAVASTRIMVSNHLTIEKFSNFDNNKKGWRIQLLEVLAIKTALVIAVCYLLVVLLFRFTPNLSVAVAQMATEQSMVHALGLVQQGAYILLTQVGIIAAIRLFRRIEA